MFETVSKAIRNRQQEDSEPSARIFGTVSKEIQDSSLGIFDTVEKNIDMNGDGRKGMTARCLQMGAIRLDLA